MPLIIAHKLFGHQPPVPDRVWLDALSIFSTERRAGSHQELSSAQRRRKRSLAVLHLQPDMTAIRCLLAVKEHLRDEFNVWYDGRHNKFKEEYDDATTSRLLGFMETISAVFRRRTIELDMVLKNHNKKEIKASHAIRDLGTFCSENYEDGREEAYKVLVLAIPRPVKFNLLEGAELVEDSYRA